MDTNTNTNATGFVIRKVGPRGMITTQPSQYLIIMMIGNYDDIDYDDKL